MSPVASVTHEMAPAALTPTSASPAPQASAMRACTAAGSIARVSPSGPGVLRRPLPAMTAAPSAVTGTQSGVPSPCTPASACPAGQAAFSRACTASKSAAKAPSASVRPGPAS